MRRYRLVSIERREGLKLDEVRLQLSARVAHHADAHLHEHRQRRSIRHAVMRRNGRVGRPAVLWIIHKLQDQITAILRHLVEQSFGYKAGRLRDAEADVRTAGLIQMVEELAVLLRSEVAVELLAQSRDHPQASIRNRPFSMIC